MFVLCCWEHVMLRNTFASTKSREAVYWSKVSVSLSLVLIKRPGGGQGYYLSHSFQKMCFCWQVPSCFITGHRICWLAHTWSQCEQTWPIKLRQDEQRNRRTASWKGQLQSADGQERQRGCRSHKTPWITANTNGHDGGGLVGRGYVKFSPEKTFQMIAWIRSVIICRHWGKVTPPPRPSTQGASCHCSLLCGAKCNLQSSNIDNHRRLHCSWSTCELNYSSYPWASFVRVSDGLREVNVI